MRAPRAVLLVVAATALLAGCGEDEEDQAAEQVCDARAGIAQQVESLQALTPETATTEAVRDSLDSIRDDLEQMGDAREELNEDMRNQVEAATQTFATTVRSIASTVLRSTSVEEARAELDAATARLAEAYRTSIGTVDCDS